MTEIDVRAFDDYEAAGWEVVADRYERLWSPITSQAIDALLDAARVATGTRVIDVGTGAGDAVARAAARGATATGVDVASAMIEIAARRHPALTFVQASVTELPFARRTRGALDLGRARALTVLRRSAGCGRRRSRSVSE